jgi:hypothetical protein
LALIARYLTRISTLVPNQYAVDAGFKLHPGRQSDKHEELDAAVQAFLTAGETDLVKAFVEGWNSTRFMEPLKHA